MRTNLPTTPSAKPLLFLLLSILMQSVATIFTKLAGLSEEQIGFMAIVTNPYFLGLLCCLGVHAISWQLVLERMPLSIAYGANGIVPIIVLLASALFFGEGVSLGNIIGCITILLGLVCVASGMESRE